MTLKERFQLLEQLGAGASGEVWRARRRRPDGSPGEEVAIKLLRHGRSNIPELEERFLQEAAILAELRSPYVVRHHETGQDGGVTYFVMEVASGERLDDWVHVRGTPARPEAVALARDLCRAVATIHEAGILHRDLKPENVVVGREGTPKLVDFGLAKAPEQTRVKTRSGLVLGTPGFLAPELLAGSDPDPSTDVYGLGALLGFLFTGQHPFQDRSLSDLLEGSLAGPDPALLARMDPDVADLVARAGHVDATRRPPAADLAEAFASLAPEGPSRRRAALPAGDVSARGPAPRPAGAAGYRALLVASILGCGVLGAWALRAVGPRTPGTRPDLAPSTDDLARAAARALGELSIPGLLEELTGKMAGEAGDLFFWDQAFEWKDGQREELLRLCGEAGWWGPYRRFAATLAPGWWTEVPAGAPGDPARELRRDLLRRLVRLRSLDLLDRTMGGPGDLVPDLARVLEPVIGVRILWAAAGRGDEFPGARTAFEPCVVLADGTDPLVANLRPAIAQNLDFRECPDIDEVDTTEQVAFPIAPPRAEETFLTLGVAVYDMRPGALLEISALDREGRTLAVVPLHLAGVPGRFPGMNVFFMRGAAKTLPAEVRMHRALLGGDLARVRIRNVGLLDLDTPKGFRAAILIGVGQLPGPLTDAELQRFARRHPGPEDDDRPATMR